MIELNKNPKKLADQNENQRFLKNKLQVNGCNSLPYAILDMSRKLIH